MRHTPLQDLIAAANRIILGKDHQIRLAIACLLARGHLLIEDMPGVGKTTLAHTLASLLGLKFQRIQFTSDLLPSDILGVSVFDRELGSFRFHQGPIFAQLILADEINRATPKTQSALLEAMEEGQITADGESLPLPQPFFVVATQNPQTQIGTFPLPESQLDRFLMRISLGYPDEAAERALLLGDDRRDMLARQQPVMSDTAFAELQVAASQVHASERLADYLQALLAATRSAAGKGYGLSPRAGLGLLNAARAWAMLEGREMVLPEDVQAVFPSVAGHRLHTLAANSTTDEPPAEALLRAVPVG
ncbi:MAG: MoxR family ATPase [Rhodocyclaceae bacterium]|nr:MoxR family ATPase [Rhodocyclaceae bacterium]